MQLHESLKFFRKNNRQIQKEVVPYGMSPSTLSRFESGNDKIGVREFLEILDTISISPEEILLFSTNDPHTKQHFYERTFLECVKNPNNSDSKKQLIQYYLNLTSKEEITQREFANLLTIKQHFSIIWPEEVEKINENDTTKAFKYLIIRKYYTNYDYSLLLKISIDIDILKLNQLIKRMLPIQDLEKRTPKTKSYAYNTLRNIITRSLYEDDIHNALYYIKIARDQFPLSQDYRFKIHIVFLEYLTEYILNPEKLDNYSKMINLFVTLQEIDETLELENMQKDLKYFLKEDRNLSDSLENKFTI